jgi:hypothetical protein
MAEMTKRAQPSVVPRKREGSATPPPLREREEASWPATDGQGLGLRGLASRRLIRPVVCLGVWVCVCGGGGGVLFDWYLFVSVSCVAE